MNTEKYIGLDVHQATISVAVLDSTGKLVMESILETKAATILQFFAGLRGTLWVTFEEGTWAARRGRDCRRCSRHPPEVHGLRPAPHGGLQPYGCASNHPRRG